MPNGTSPGREQFSQLSYCGLWEDAGVITLEHSTHGSPGRNTPVNFSGPARRVADAEWYVLADIDLVDE